MTKGIGSKVANEMAKGLYVSASAGTKRENQLLRAEIESIESAARVWKRFNPFHSVAHNVERMVRLLDDLELLRTRHEADRSRIAYLEARLTRNS